MRRLLLSLLPLLVLVAMPANAAPPAEAFCVILIAPGDDFATLEVLVDEDLEPDDRLGRWQTIDADGNGMVSIAERESYRWRSTTWHDRGEGMGPKRVTLEPGAPYVSAREQLPVYGTTWNQVGHVFHGQHKEIPDPLTAPEDLETQEVRRFGFEEVEEPVSRYWVRGGRENATPNASVSPSVTQEPRPVIEYVVVEAPEGWEVHRIEGWDYDGPFVLEPRSRTVDVPAFDTTRPWTVYFVHPELEEDLGRIGGGIPAAPALAVALLLALVVWRRR